jgi:hypothetical protein
MDIKESGRVKYTGRAFSQDAQEAMGGKIERALAELITNCDDSYARLQRQTGRATKSAIRIEIERHRKRNWTLIVRDRAEGMSGREMKDKLTVLGRQTSGIDSGENVRGLLGRGGRDVAAFGAVTWESIKDGRYCRLELEPTGKWHLSRSTNAIQGLRDTLRIPRGNGTVVTVDVDKSYRYPQHAKLCENLARYYSLRDIMSDPNRRIILFDLNRTDQKGDRLLYSPPDGELRIDEDISIPGYADVEARLQIWRHGTRFDEDKRSPYRENAILVKSGRAIHEVTLFGLESEPYAERFFGRLECPYIDTLVNEYDERFAQGDPPVHANPSRLISRRRDGLDAEHPFTQALFCSAREWLELLVEEEKGADEERHKRIESEETRARLTKLANAARRFMLQKMREFDEEFDLAEVVGPEGLIPDLAIIPAGCRISPGETKTLSVLSRTDLAADQVVTLSLEPGSTGIRLLATRIPLEPDDKVEDALRGTFKVKAIPDEGRAAILARRDGAKAVAEVSVADQEMEMPLPEVLGFERETYRVVRGKTKAIRVLAPMSLLRNQGKTVHISSTNRHIVVKRHKVRLKPSEDGTYAVAVTQVEGRQLDARGTLHATVGSAKAAAALHVVQRRLAGPPLEFRLVNEDFGHQRAVWDPPDGYLLKIAGRHESVSRYLGSVRDDYPGKDRPHFRVLLAEIIAGSVCQRLLIDKMRKKKRKYGPGEDLDAVGFYHEHLRLMGQFLPIAHKAMLSRQEVKTLRQG